MSVQTDPGVYLQGYHEDQQGQQGRRDQLHPTRGPKMSASVHLPQMLKEVGRKGNRGGQWVLVRAHSCIQRGLMHVSEIEMKWTLTLPNVVFILEAEGVLVITLAEIL